jgi:hypothetical protein
MRYNYDLLKQFIKDNNISILDNLSPEININRNTIINGLCIKCNENFKKSFRALVKNNGYCNICCINNGKIKQKETNLEKYGTEYPLQNEDIKNKIKQTNIEKYGFENPFQNKEVKDKIIETNIKKYGVKSAIQNKEIMKKIQNTNMEKYGCINVAQNENVKNKMKKTNMEKYGVEYNLQSKEIRIKIENTNLQKYGNKMTLQNDEIKEKSKITCLKKYGYEYATQNAIISSKQYSNSNKQYIYPSGFSVNIQGYENFALNILLKTYNEKDILTKKIDMPVIKYDYKNKNRIYFPDIYIPKNNLIIEVKSYYTYKNYLIKNILKALATRKLNFNYEIWIFDKNSNLLII